MAKVNQRKGVCTRKSEILPITVTPTLYSPSCYFLKKHHGCLAENGFPRPRIQLKTYVNVNWSAPL